VSNIPQKEYESLKNEVNEKYKECQALLTRLEERWRNEAEETKFKNKKNELELVHRDYFNLPSLRQQKINELHRQKQKVQLEAFLEKHYIDKASIPKVGPGRKATLQSYGINTAADINQRDIYRIQGFGPVYTNNLLNWRKSIENKFVYNPNLPIDPYKIAEIDRDISARKDRLEKTLKNGLIELQKISEQTMKIRPILYNEFDNCLKEYAQVKANKMAFEK